MPINLETIKEASFIGYLLVFAAGILTSLGPCNITMIPLVVAFVGGQKQIGQGRALALSSTFALGLAITLMLLGITAGMVGGLLGGSSRLWYYVVAGVCILMGLVWVGIIKLPMPEWGSRLQARVTQKGLVGALLLGLVSGLVASGCATPALAAILTLVMSRGALVYGASLLLVYGLGRGVPIVVIGTFAGMLKLLPKLAHWTERIQQFSGALLLLIGAYFIMIA